MLGKKTLKSWLYEDGKGYILPPLLLSSLPYHSPKKFSSLTIMILDRDFLMKYTGKILRLHFISRSEPQSKGGAR